MVVKKDTKVTIIMPVFNNLKYTQQAITTLQEYTTNYNLIVVNDGSTDETKEWLEAQGIETINQKNLGFTKAVNQGIILAKKSYPSTYMCILNNDVLLFEGWLDECRKMLEKGYVCVWPSYTNGDKEFTKKVDWKGVKLYWDHIDRTEQEKFSFAINSHILPGHCFIIESVIFKELGLLDEKMVMLWSDIDFHKRLAVKKKKVGACFTAQIHHFGHKTTDIVDIDEQAKKDTQYFFKKWPTLKKIGAKYSYSKRILEVK